MARLLADENFPLPVVEALRRLGHDVLTMLDAGKANQRIPDADVLELARLQERAVLTPNRKHFVRLHQASAEHAGVIACTADLDFEGQARRVHEALASRGTLARVLIRLNRPG